MNRAFFYPAGRERTDAIGALDLALWDIKGKALGCPVHQLLGGTARNYCELYNTAGIIPGITEGMSIRERARLTIEAGYRAFRFGAADAPANTTYNTREQTPPAARGMRAGAAGRGPGRRLGGGFSSALRSVRRDSRLQRDREPGAVLRGGPGADRGVSRRICRILRNKVNVPLAAGEEWGNKWDFNRLVEEHSIDFVRATLPNVGGITEMMKIAALCETHFVGIVPHFTGPIATAALVHCLSTFSGPVLMEYNYQGRTLEHLPVCLDFKNGKLYPNDRPGLGVELDFKHLKQIAEITEPVTARAQTYFRPDGSITNW